MYKKDRVVFVFFTTVVMFFVILVRLFYIQVIEYKKYYSISKKQSLKRIIVPAKRGKILDVNGKVLAMDVESKIVIRDTLDIKRDSVVERKFFESLVKRVYLYKDLAGPLIGYTGYNNHGIYGCELSFDSYLNGEDGWRFMMKDGKNRYYPIAGLPKKDPVPGANVYLTIDVEIQQIVESELQRQVESLHAKGGMAIVADPNTGRILAMANYPGINPVAWQKYPAEYRKNRCISYNYEPGSTFKIFTAAAAMEEELVHEFDTIDIDNGLYRIYDQVIRDHSPYQFLTFREAIAYSSNVSFAKIANIVGNTLLYKYVKNFGFGEKTDIQLPAEEIGIVHPINKWSGRTRVTMAIGQEISVTFLQMIMGFCAVANGGVLLTPIICDKIVDNNGKIIYKSETKPKRRVFSEKIAFKLRDMMRDVVNYGTAKTVQMSDMDIAGKTGTSQKINKETGGYYEDKYWSSFIGFSPVEKPEIVIGVVIDEPANGEAGGVAAGPVVKRILRRLVNVPNLQYARKLIRKKKNNEIKQNHEKTKTYASVFESPIKKKKVKSNVYKIGNLNKDVTIVPACIGLTLKESVNRLIGSGITPYVVGDGRVEKQSPGVGTVVSFASPCTLYCTF